MAYFSKKYAKWVAAALGAGRDPNGCETDSPAHPFGSPGWRCPGMQIFVCEPMFSCRPLSVTRLFLLTCEL
jgi:hypothetical protein